MISCKPVFNDAPKYLIDNDLLHDDDYRYNHFTDGLVIALGTLDYIYPDIDKFYAKRKAEYKEAYDQSSYAGYYLSEGYSAIADEKMRKVMGMLAWAIEGDNYHVIDSLTRKGYKQLVSHVSANHKRLDLNDIINEKIIKMIRVRRKQYKGIEQLQYLLIFVYYLYAIDHLSESFEKEPIIKYILESMEGLFLQGKSADIYITGMNQSVKFDYIEVLDKYIEDKLHIDLDVFKFYEMNMTGLTATQFMVNLRNVYTTMDDQYTELINDPGQLIMPDKLNRIRTRERNKTYYDLVLHFQEVFRFIGLVPEMIMTINVTLSDLRAAAFLLQKEDPRKPDKWFKDTEESLEQRAHTFLSVLLFKVLKDQIFDAKELCFGQYYTETKEEIAQAKARFDEKECSLSRQLLEKTEEAATLKQENKRYIDELEKQEKIIQQLQAQVAMDQSDRKKLLELRAYAYQPFEEEPSHTERKRDVINQIERYIEPYNIAFVSGHCNLQTKIKSVFPSVRIVDTDNTSRDLRFLRKMDAIFFYTNHSSHAMYNKMNASIKELNIPIFYVPRFNNQESIVEFMVDRMTTLNIVAH